MELEKGLKVEPEVKIEVESWAKTRAKTHVAAKVAVMQKAVKGVAAQRLGQTHVQAPLRSDGVGVAKCVVHE